MRNWIHICLLCCAALAGFPGLLQAQEQDTVWFTEKKPRTPTHFKFHLVGASMADASFQYFDGFNQEVLYTNSRSGLPLYSDWMVFSGYSNIPQYYSFYAHAGMADTTKHLRLRFGLGFYHKEDSLYYTGGFAVRDTVYIRTGTESVSFLTAHISGLKTTRRLLHVMRLYAGAELEVGLSPTSKITFHEYEYDFGDDEILQHNTFYTDGKLRVNALASAMVGVEAVLGKRVGLHAEARSGIGGHWVPKQGAFGLSRIGYRVGIDFRFLDH